MRFILFGIGLMVAFAPLPALAGDVYAMHNVNLRAGPDGGYPVVSTIRQNERLELKGCIGNLQWCEVESRRGDYGWVYAPYLRTRSGNNNVTIIQSYNTGGTHIVIFQPRSYWDRHYKDRDFYKQRKRWIRDDDWNGHDRDDDVHGRGRDRDWNDDNDDDHRGRGRDRGRGHDEDSRTVVTPPKYQSMEMPSGNKGRYNPLCPMGVSDC